MELTQVYTVDEVASRLKVSPKTVRYWLRAGQLAGIKTGKLWRIRAQDLDAFVTAHFRQAETTAAPAHPGEGGSRHGRAEAPPSGAS
jgi:excisionase family DNA binding protein